MLRNKNSQNTVLVFRFDILRLYIADIEAARASTRITLLTENTTFLVLFVFVKTFFGADSHITVLDIYMDLVLFKAGQINCKTIALSIVRQKMDIVIVTAKTLNGATPASYADDTYDYNGYGNNRDGLLLLISMEDRDWYISTTGYGITAFTDAGIQYIGNKIKEHLSDGDYDAAFNSFAELCDDFITKARDGKPYDSGNMPKEPMKKGWILAAIIAGFLLSFITVGTMKSKLKTVRFQPMASSYMKAGSMNITESRDMFLYNTVTRTAKPKDNDSGGGSSTHSSSSGTSHGGGGGKF